MRYQPQVMKLQDDTTVKEETRKAFAHNTEMKARINLNNLRGAMSDYDNALDLDPNNFLAHYNRGLMRVQLSDDNRAITDFDFIIKMEPQNFMAIFNRALLHDKIEQEINSLRRIDDGFERIVIDRNGCIYLLSLSL